MKKGKILIAASLLAANLAAEQSYMPIVAYTDKTGLIYGAAAFAYQDGNPGYQFGGYGVTNGDDFHSLSLAGEKRSSQMKLAASATASKTFDDYYGEGDQTPSEPFYQIDEDLLQGEASALFNQGGSWAIGPVLGMKYLHEEDVESLPPADLQAPSRLIPDEANPELGVRALLDNRNSSLNASQGNFLQVDLRAYPQALALLDDGNSDAWQAQIEWRRFQELGSGRVWAQRLEGGDSLGDPSYEETYQLGGTDLLRGFQDNRFRGKAFYCAQEEMRFPLWRQLGGALSADLGDAGDAALVHPRGSLQAGIRLGLPPSYGMKARLDLGQADDGSRSVALQFGQLF